MDRLFLKLFNMSVSAAWIVLAVVILRLLLKKAPKYIRVAMWAVVGLRLVCPFSVKSALSLIPSREVISMDTVMYSPAPTVDTGIGFIDSAVNPGFSQSFTPPPGASVNPLAVVTAAASWVWLAGLILMAGYFIISAWRLSRRMRGAREAERGVFESPSVPSPFVFGFVRPRIYLPAGMEPDHREYVLAHERAHIRRRDYLIKPLGFLLLAVYWFNPAMWAAYILLCRDIELACDERVLAELGPDCKKPYTQALLASVAFHRNIAACPVAFGEGRLRDRVKNVLSWKKPVIWVTIASLVICAVLAVCFLTDPKDGGLPDGVSYVYDGQGFGSDFGVYLAADGTFSYYEGAFSSYVGMGTWTEEDGVVTLTDKGTQSHTRTYRFRREGRDLCFMAGESDSFTHMDLAEGAVFRRERDYHSGVRVDDAYVSFPPADGYYFTVETSGLGRLWEHHTGNAEPIWSGRNVEDICLWGGESGESLAAVVQDGSVLVIETATGREHRPELPENSTSRPVAWLDGVTLAMSVDTGGATLDGILRLDIPEPALLPDGTEAHIYNREGAWLSDEPEYYDALLTCRNLSEYEASYPLAEQLYAALTDRPDLFAQSLARHDMAVTEDVSRLLIAQFSTPMDALGGLLYHLGTHLAALGSTDERVYIEKIISNVESAAGLEGAGDGRYELRVTAPEGGRIT